MVIAIDDRPKSTPYGEMQDRVRSILLSRGEKEVFLTVDDLAGKASLSYSQAYQTLYRLSQLGELEILSDTDDTTGRAKVVGVKLLRMEPAEEIAERNTERVVVKQADKELATVATSVPNTLDYIRKKSAIEKARLDIMRSNTGLDANEVIAFEPDPLGEEAIVLMARLQELIKANRMLTNDLEAEKRNVLYYRDQAGVGLGDSGT